MNFFIGKIKKVSLYGWMLVIVILIGIFLRTYNLHSWLEFRDDQSRDAILVSQVLNGERSWPIVGPYMSYSGNGDHEEDNSFHIGPIYYYFQIISAKIFGDYPDKLAYPDVFFSVISILLLYVFLKIYFKQNMALGITGLYAISAYFIHYSRFAWNSNLIPCFVLLFLLSLFKLMDKNEKPAWLWTALVGIAMGVGIQLHAILIPIFLLVAFCVFLFSMKKDYKIWKRWAAIFLIIAFLNVPQIYSELKTNFSNTKIFFDFSSHNNNGVNESKLGWLGLLKNDLDCNIEANSYFLSSYGSMHCSYDIFSPATYTEIRWKSSSKMFQDLIAIVTMLIGIIFSLLGYYLLIKNAKEEPEKNKKYFLYLVALYAAISFIIMIPLSTGKLSDLRYYTPTCFVAYIFLGFLFKFLEEKIVKKHLYLIFAIFIMLVFTNVQAITDVASTLMAGNKSCDSHSAAATLGEMESVAQYISNSYNQRVVYFGGEGLVRIEKGPLMYVLKKHKIDFVNANQNISHNGPTYMISCKAGAGKHYSFKEIGNIYVFDLNSPAE